MGNFTGLLDLKYGERERNYLDLYIPDDKKETMSLILFIHGGGWIAGDKKDYAAHLQNWLRKGYVTAAMNYTFVTKTTHMTDIVTDITNALAKIKTVCAENGINVKKCLLTGLSAGGHLSLLYAYSQAETAPITPVAVVDFVGPSDMNADDFIFNPIFDNTPELFSHCCGVEFDGKNITEEAREKLKEISPITYITEKTVPTLMAYGFVDDIVPYSQAEVLAQKLTENKVTHTVVTYPRSGHGLEKDYEKTCQTQELFELYAKMYLK